MANTSDPFDFSGPGSGSGAPFDTRPRSQVSPPRSQGGDPLSAPADNAQPGTAGRVDPFSPYGYPQDPDVRAPQSGALVTGPPILWLLIGLLTAAAGAAVAWVAGTEWSFAVASWVLAGPLSIGVLALFTLQDTRRRAAIYSHQTWVPAAYWFVLGCAVVGVGVSAWRLAGLFGRL